ncbi:MAG: hypothetical protein HQL37_14300 [Alphaproteobacteria bacterium]|nr:hypothetical protein [Alphaproteobacteria bacterium]
MDKSDRILATLEQFIATHTSKAEVADPETRHVYASHREFTMDKSDRILAALEQLISTVATKAEVAELRGDVRKLESGQTRIETEVAKLRTDMESGQTRIEWKLDVAELKGRVEEISRRQGVTLAYEPPSKRGQGA